MPDLTTTINTELKSPDFISATFSGINRSQINHSWIKITLSPVIIQEESKIQINYYTSLKCTTKNLSKTELKKTIREIIALQFSSVYLRSNNYGVQIQITKKGKILINKHKNLETLTPSTEHDRQKTRIHNKSEQPLYLQELGITNVKGQIISGKQKKFKQIDEFLKIIENLENWKARETPIRIIDCGSGNAYLSFAMYHYFQEILGKEVFLTGIDIDAGAVERSRQRATNLGWENIKFEVGNILGHILEQEPDIVLALHACDNATDEALMKGITENAKHIIAVPCCQQDLQKRMKKEDLHPLLKSYTKHKILKERTCDLTTDTFRSMLLELHGYDCQVLQYISTEHTAKNIMIKASKSDKAIDPLLQVAYQELKESWGGIIPVLEELLER